MGSITGDVVGRNLPVAREVAGGVLHAARGVSNDEVVDPSYHMLVVAGLASPASSGGVFDM